MAEKDEFNWQHILYPHEISVEAFPANSLKRIKIDNKRFCMARTEEGFFAVDDVCPHAGGSLSQGRYNGKGIVICPLHRYGFNLRTGQNAMGSGPNTTAYITQLRSDGLYIGLPKKKWWFW